MTSILNNTPGGGEYRKKRERKRGVGGTEGKEGLKRRGKMKMDSVRNERGGVEEVERNKGGENGGKREETGMS